MWVRPCYSARSTRRPCTLVKCALLFFVRELEHQMLDNSCSSTAAVAHHFTWAAAAEQTEFIYRPLGLPSSIIATLNQRDDLDSSVNSGTSQSHLSVSVTPSNFLSTIIGSSATTIHGTATQVCQFVSLPPSADVIDRVEHFNTDSR